MEIEAVYERHDCRCCGQLIVKEIVAQQFLCDGCGKNIDELVGSRNRKNADYLRVQVFVESQPCKVFHFCSWDCLVKTIPKMPPDDFTTLPYLHADGTVPKGQGFGDFLRAIGRRRPASARTVQEKGRAGRPETKEKLS